MGVGVGVGLGVGLKSDTCFFSKGTTDSDFICCALFTEYSINNIYRNYMKYKKRKEIKQYIARKKICSVTKVTQAFVLVTDTYKQLT